MILNLILICIFCILKTENSSWRCRWLVLRHVKRGRPILRLKMASHDNYDCYVQACGFKYGHESHKWFGSKTRKVTRARTCSSYSEDGCSRFLRIVGTCLPNYSASHRQDNPHSHHHENFRSHVCVYIYIKKLLFLLWVELLPFYWRPLSWSELWPLQRLGCAGRGFTPYSTIVKLWYNKPLFCYNSSKGVMTVELLMLKILHDEWRSTNLLLALLELLLYIFMLVLWWQRSIKLSQGSFIVVWGQVRTQVPALRGLEEKENGRFWPSIDPLRWARLCPGELI
jgi:hypothetical protein